LSIDLYKLVQYVLDDQIWINAAYLLIFFYYWIK
jgi:hypothetical protein